MNQPEKICIIYEDRDLWTSRMIEEGMAPSRTKRLALFLESAESIAKIADGIRVEIDRRSLDIDVEVIEISQRLQIARLASKRSVMVWSLTDGRHPYRGSYVPCFARLMNICYFGNGSFAQSLAQEKFKFNALCEAVGVKVPRTTLMRAARVISINPLLDDEGPFFVRPAALDNKIGISDSSIALDWKMVEKISSSIYEDLGADAIVQPYIQGHDLRVSFLDIGRELPVCDALDVRAARPRTQDEGTAEYRCEDVSDGYPETIASPFDIIGHYSKDIDLAIRQDIGLLFSSLELRDIFAFDIRLDHQGRHHILELNSSPFVGSGRYEDYAIRVYGLTLHEALLESILNRFKVFGESRKDLRQ